MPRFPEVERHPLISPYWCAHPQASAERRGAPTSSALPVPVLCETARKDPWEQLPASNCSQDAGNSLKTQPCYQELVICSQRVHPAGFGS